MQCIPEYSANELESYSYSFNDSFSHEMYYSFESSLGQDGLDQFSLDDCSGLIGQGQSHSLNNHFDQEWFPLSSTPVTRNGPCPFKLG